MLNRTKTPRHMPSNSAQRARPSTTPLADSDITLSGRTKMERKDANKKRIERELKKLSGPRPQVEDHVHPGFRLIGPRLSVGTSDILNAGRWYQMCTPINEGVPETPQGRSKVQCYKWLTPRVSAARLFCEPLAAWWRIKAELEAGSQAQILSALEGAVPPAAPHPTGTSSLTMPSDTITLSEDSDFEVSTAPRQQQGTGASFLSHTNAEQSQREIIDLTLASTSATSSSSFTAQQKLDANTCITVMGWHTDCAPSRSTVVLARLGRRLVLSDHEGAMNKIGFEFRVPIEKYVVTSGKWKKLRWDTPLAVADGDIIFVREEGVCHMAGWEDHAAHLLEEPTRSGALFSMLPSSSPQRASSPLDRVAQRRG